MYPSACSSSCNPVVQSGNIKVYSMELSFISSALSLQRLFHTFPVQLYFLRTENYWWIRWKSAFPGLATPSLAVEQWTAVSNGSGCKALKPVLRWNKVTSGFFPEIVKFHISISLFQVFSMAILLFVEGVGAQQLHFSFYTPILKE